MDGIGMALLVVSNIIFGFTLGYFVCRGKIGVIDTARFPEIYKKGLAVSRMEEDHGSLGLVAGMRKGEEASYHDWWFALLGYSKLLGLDDHVRDMGHAFWETYYEDEYSVADAVVEAIYNDETMQG